MSGAIPLLTLCAFLDSFYRELHQPFGSFGSKNVLPVLLRRAATSYLLTDPQQAPIPACSVNESPS